MDRFIGVACSAFNGIFVDLKSNMDRFIVQDEKIKDAQKTNLKSNMDRFIEKKINDIF